MSKMPDDAAEGPALRFVLRENPPPGGLTGNPPEILYAPGQTLAQALFLSGRVAPPALCSGLSLCGRCKVRVLESPETLPPLPDEEAFFSVAELESGMRLACRRAPLPGLQLEVVPERPVPPGFAPAVAKGPAKDRAGEHTGKRAESPASEPASELAAALAAPPARPLPEAPGAGQARRALAVDLGTTSLVWRLEDAEKGILAQGSLINPQMGAGSDVMSRLSVAARPGGLARLYGLTLAALRGIVRRLPPECAPELICLAANPAMSAIALGLDPASLAAAPYTLPEKGGRWFELPGLPPLWLPPQLSPFVGGDLAAGYAALALHPGVAAGSTSAREPAALANEPEYPWLLADLGTNGELLLPLSPQRALAASVPMGPALEGAGLARGTEARPGAAVDYRLGPQGLEALLLPGPTASATGRNAAKSAAKQNPAESGRDPVPAQPGQKQAGLSGTGALALLGLLLRHGLLDRQGRFLPPRGPLARFFAFRKGPRGQQTLDLPGGLYLCAGDVEELLKVKAAFSLALACLLDAAGLEARNLRAVRLAGALGLHLRGGILADLGFLPPGLEARVLTVGNSSLEGAALLALNSGARAAVTAWAAGVRALNLAADPAFADTYPSHMLFSWQP